MNHVVAGHIAALDGCLGLAGGLVGVVQTYISPDAPAGEVLGARAVEKRILNGGLDESHYALVFSNPGPGYTGPWGTGRYRAGPHSRGAPLRQE